MRPNYTKMRAIIELARGLFPNASKFVPLWTPASANGDYCLEVWQDGRASVYAEDTLRVLARWEAVA